MPGCSHFNQPGKQRDGLDEATTNWRAVCGKTACTVRREGWAKAHPYPYHDAMFSDFKSRGFGLEDSQLQRTDRMDRLIMVMSLALYWAVSTGMWAAEHAALPAEKKRPTRVRRKSLAA